MKLNNMSYNREGFKKIWKFFMAFAIEDGGVSRAITFFSKMFFVKTI